LALLLKGEVFRENLSLFSRAHVAESRVFAGPK
jgi:hypothetical protein